MIRKDRLIKTFIELAGIPGLSRKEGQIANEIARRLNQLGVKVQFDRGLAEGGETGNLIGYLNGNSFAPPLLLNAHLDTVGPMENYGFRRAGNCLLSKGKSILGADDRSGVAVILEVLEHLKESRPRHPGLEIVFTVAEEVGLLGAKNLDYSILRARHGIVLDSDSPLEPIIAAPEAYRLIFKVLGKTAHAGVSPERGINAIQIASRAISKIKLGRIDFETTANLGIIRGGTATNIVPDLVEVRGEARSHNRKKLKAQIARMRSHFQKAVKQARSRKFKGRPRLEEEIIFDYPLMKIPHHHFLLKLIRKAGKELGKEIAPKVGGGGSDANIFNAHKIESIILGSGMQQVHTVEEKLNLDRLYLSAQMLAKIVELYPALSKRK